jgi:hypothetical protein
VAGSVVSVGERVDVLLEVADGLHPVEQPTSCDLRLWEDWTVARRLRELAAGLLES